MAQFRIELNGDGIRELLASSEVQAMLARKAHQVKDAADGQHVQVSATEEPFQDVDIPVTVVEAGNAKRARALVTLDHPAGLAVEAKHRLLAGSLDAANA